MNNSDENNEGEKPAEPPTSLTSSMSAPSLANLPNNHERNEPIPDETSIKSNPSPERKPPSSKMSTPHKSSCNTTPSSHLKRSFSMTNMAPVRPLQILNRQYTSPYSEPVAWTVPKRGSSTPSKPFTIYQDPPWYDPPSPDYDSEGDLEASDDKENAYPAQQLDGHGHPSDSNTNPNSSGTTTPTATTATAIDNAVFEAENIVELASRNARSRATPDPFGNYVPAPAHLRRPLTSIAVPVPRPEGPLHGHWLASEMELSAEVDAVLAARASARARALRRLRGHSDLRAWALGRGAGEDGDGDENARPRFPGN